jgi:alpha-tubulin suppressor-like RCC1 family protein
LSPVAIIADSGGITVVSVSAGAIHTCALLSDATVNCWGYGQDGQTGTGVFTNDLTPTAVSGLTSISKISAGGKHTCAVKSDGSVFCWGAGESGQRGEAIQLLPVTTAGFP